MPKTNSGRPRLDPLNLQIIRLLQTDGRMTTKLLASTLNSTEVTIRKRLGQLIESNILAVRATVEPSQLGYQQEVILSISVDAAYIEPVGQALASFAEVRFVAITSGSYDIICIVVVSETKALLQFIAEKVSGIEGINSINTALSLKVLKRASSWIPELITDSVAP